ncbi:MAG: restriction endonuclease subunit S [Erysipelotrichaceae bacterium]|nr:restriction endonuclease subunit S [Erysipelotrichaceae bacterium]
MENKLSPEIRFPGFTDPWEQRKLGDLLEDLYNGQTPSRANADFWNGSISWLSSGELNRGIVDRSVETITEAGQDSAHLRIVPKGTFIMAITGLEASGTRGNCAILGLDTTLNQSCMALFPNKEHLDSRFLFQWYRKVGEEYGINYTQGTKQQSYNAELIKILPISVPSLKEQKVISDYLFEVDNLITLHQSKLDKLKNLKKGLLQKMFPKNGENVPEIRFPGFTDPWEQRKLEDLIKEDVMLAPQDGNHGEKHPTSAEYVDDGIPFLMASDIKNGLVDYYGCSKITKERALKLDKGFAHEGDVLITHKATIGETAILKGLKTDFAMLTPQVTFYRIINPKVLNAGYLKSYFDSSLFQTIIKRISYQSTRPYIGISEQRKLPISYPNIEEQVKLSNFFQLLDDSITLHQSKLDKLQNLKKGLLAKMFV